MRYHFECEDDDCGHTFVLARASGDATCKIACPMCGKPAGRVYSDGVPELLSDPEEALTPAIARIRAVFREEAARCAATTPTGAGASLGAHDRRPMH